MKNFIFFLLRTLILILLAGVVFLWARGVSFDYKNNSFQQLGIASITTSPPEAELTVDSEIKGLTPQERVILLPGTHNFQVTKLGFRPWKKTILVSENQVEHQDSILLIPEQISQSKTIFPKAEFIQPLLFQNQTIVITDKKQLAIIDNSKKENMGRLIVKGELLGDKIKTFTLSENGNKALYVTVNANTNALIFSVIDIGQQVKLLFSNTLITPSNNIITEPEFKKVILSDQSFTVITTHEIINYDFNSRKSDRIYNTSNVILDATIKKGSLFFMDSTSYVLQEQPTGEVQLVKGQPSGAQTIFSSLTCSIGSRKFHILQNPDFLAFNCGNDLYAFELGSKNLYLLAEENATLIGDESTSLWYTSNNSIRRFLFANKIDYEAIETVPGKISTFLPIPQFKRAFLVYLQPESSSYQALLFEDDGTNSEDIGTISDPSQDVTVDCVARLTTIVCYSNHTDSLEQTTLSLQPNTNDEH
ncbi:MAG: PEGA domain-containing protein [bacterium]